MSDLKNFGPLAALVGKWEGSKGMDVAPESDGVEENPYFETIDYEVVGDVTNAEEQTLWVLRYHQVVSRQSNKEVFHDETGYWMWDPATNVVMQSLAIPRGVTLLAGGDATEANGSTTFKVKASIASEEWQIAQSPFMKEKATTTAFSHEVIVKGDEMEYSETTSLKIYGKPFKHTDGNSLKRVG